MMFDPTNVCGGVSPEFRLEGPSTV